MECLALPENPISENGLFPLSRLLLLLVGIHTHTHTHLHTHNTERTKTHFISKKQHFPSYFPWKRGYSSVSSLCYRSRPLFSVDKRCCCKVWVAKTRFFFFLLFLFLLFFFIISFLHFYQTPLSPSFPFSSPPPPPLFFPLSPSQPSCTPNSSRLFKEQKQK